MYEEFIKTYPYIIIGEKDFEIAQQEANTNNLDLLRDYIISQDLCEEVIE